MKVKLFGLAALILLSAISSIFNAMPMIGASAQGYDSSYGNNNNYNGMVDNYSYEEPNTYNTDNNDYSNYDPSTYEQNSEYSSYNSYGPPTPNYGDGNAEYSSYDNGYGNAYNNEYQDDSYYADQYNKNYYPPQKPKTFICPDSYLVVDKPENCPLICPEDTTLEGHLVTAGSNLTQICNAASPAVQCPDGSTLQGVWVHPDDIETCNIAIPPPIQIFECPADSNLPGANVTDLRLCDAPNDANICPDETDLGGVYVNNTATDCDLDIPLAEDLEIQCIKCADLAAGSSGGGQQPENALIGNTTLNVFSVCDDPDPRPGFANITLGFPQGQRVPAQQAFDLCLDNAGVNPGNGTSTSQALISSFQTFQESSLTTNVKTEAERPIFSVKTQENSLTTNVKTEAEIPTFSVKTSPPPFSPPSIAQGIEDSSSTLAKIDKLKKQWLDLLP